MEKRALGNTDANGTKKNVSDVEFFGNGDEFKLICKASSKKQGWMKSTKAMQIGETGVVVQVTTQQVHKFLFWTWSSVAEAVTFVPDVVLRDTLDENGDVIGRKVTRR